MNLHNNQIANISQKAFDGLLQLLTLNLSSNALKEIPNEAFFGLVSLRQLDLSKNYLDRLDNKTNGLLDDCLSLQSVSLIYFLSLNLILGKIGFETYFVNQVTKS